MLETGFLVSATRTTQATAVVVVGCMGRLYAVLLITGHRFQLSRCFPQPPTARTRMHLTIVVRNIKEVQWTIIVCSTSLMVLILILIVNLQIPWRGNTQMGREHAYGICASSRLLKVENRPPLLKWVCCSTLVWCGMKKSARVGNAYHWLVDAISCPGFLSHVLVCWLVIYWSCLVV